MRDEYGIDLEEIEEHFLPNIGFQSSANQNINNTRANNLRAQSIRDQQAPPQPSQNNNSNRNQQRRREQRVDNLVNRLDARNNRRQFN